MTLRRWNHARVAVGQRAFCPGLGYLLIESVEPVEWADLDEDDAVADGFKSLREMKKTLLSIYPDDTDGKRWWRIRFEWEKPDGWIEPAQLFE